MITKAHTQYKLQDGIVVPGVTTVIAILDKPALLRWANNQGLKGIDCFKDRDDKGDMGSLAHSMILSYFKKQELDTSDYTKNQIDKAENSYLKFLEWVRDKSFEPTYLETPFVSEKYKFGGMPDYVGLINGTPTILDFKTGSGIFEEHLIQVAAYKMLIEGHSISIESLRILNIGRDESESFEERFVGNPDKYEQIFLHCLAIYNLRKQIKGEK